MANDLVTRLQTAVQRTRSDERGATMIEYGLMVALIAIDRGSRAADPRPAIVGLFTDVAGNL
jgi:pilus assembly protein Flp/PilA